MAITSGSACFYPKCLAFVCVCMRVSVYACVYLCVCMRVSVYACVYIVCGGSRQGKNAAKRSSRQPAVFRLTIIKLFLLLKSQRGRERERDREHKGKKRESHV